MKKTLYCPHCEAQTEHQCGKLAEFSPAWYYIPSMVLAIPMGAGLVFLRHHYEWEVSTGLLFFIAAIPFLVSIVLFFARLWVTCQKCGNKHQASEI